MSTCKFSIIVPVYNTEQQLHRCIDSILSQTYTNFELLLINDGSTDSSGSICDGYEQRDSRVRVFHKKNGGVSSARNTGLINAKGEWIAFVDSDDWVGDKWLDGFVSSGLTTDLMIQGFSAKNWPYAKIIEEICVNLIENIYNKKEIIECINYLYKVHNVGFLWCRLFKKSIIKEYDIRFNENYPLREDQEFIFHYMTKINSIKTIPISEYHYDCPSYSSKYKSISMALEAEITISILTHINSMTPVRNTYAHIESVNRLSSSIISEMRRNFDWNNIRYYSKFFYRLCKDVDYINMSRKSKILYMVLSILRF